MIVAEPSSKLDSGSDPPVPLTRTRGVLHSHAADNALYAASRCSSGHGWVNTNNCNNTLSRSESRLLHTKGAQRRPRSREEIGYRPWPARLHGQPYSATVPRPSSPYSGNTPR